MPEHCRRVTTGLSTCRADVFSNREGAQGPDGVGGDGPDTVRG